MSFQDHPLYRLAKRDMLAEVASFPWSSLNVMEDAQEQDALAAGFTTARQADAQQAEHLMALVQRTLESGTPASAGSKILLTLTSDSEAKPRSRGMIQALQAIVNAGLPGFISDHVEPPNEQHDYIRHYADLRVVFPHE